MVRFRQQRDALVVGLRFRGPIRSVSVAKAIGSTNSEQTHAKNNEPPLANSDYEHDVQQEVGGNTAASNDSTPLAHQNDQMGSVLLPLLDLHHSADNHLPSPHDITLTYPSGHSERFSFGKRVQKREHKYARTLEPIKDLITTIEVICIQFGTNKDDELMLKREILETAFQNRANIATADLQTLVHDIRGWKRKRRLQRFDCALRPELVEHFIDQLHDRAIADVASLLERTGEKSTDSTYGELTPQFLSLLFLETNLTASCTFLDLGSGVGQTCMQAALETQCTSFGVEREGKCHTVAITHLHQFKVRSALWGLNHGGVHLRKGDFLNSAFMDELLSQADVVLVNNLVLSSETDVALRGILVVGLKTGTRVVSTRPLAPIARPARSTKGSKRPRTDANATVNADEELVERSGEDQNWKWEQKVFDVGSVSWSHKQGLYYISVKK